MYRTAKVRQELISASARTAIGQGTFFPWPWCPEARGLIAAHRLLVEAMQRLNSKALRTLIA